MSQLSIFRKHLLIIAMVACYALIFIDESGIAVTLPMIQKSLSMSTNTLHWVVNSYLLILSVLLLFGGKLSDLYGKRKVFMIGILVFMGASILCACSQVTWMLISGRLLQGVGASLLMPCIIVIVHRSVSESEFGKVLGLILAASNFFYAMGPFIGGAITEYASWHWFFWINLPVGLICLGFTYISVDRDALEHSAVFKDFPGLLTLIVMLSTLVVAIMQGADWGWSSFRVLSLFLVSFVSLLGFIKIELSAKLPLLELCFFQSKIFSASAIMLFCTAICLTLMVYLALWLQFSMGYSPATVGLSLLPASIAFIVLPTLGGMWRDKKGPRQPMFMGIALMFFGVLWLSVTIRLHDYLWLLPGLIAYGSGIPLVIPCSYMTLVSSVEPEHSGMASGIATTIRQLSLSVGIAILSAVITSYNNSHLAMFLRSSADYKHISISQVQSLLSGKQISLDLTSTKLQALLFASRQIDTQAMTHAALVMLFFLAIAMLCWKWFDFE